MRTEPPAMVDGPPAMFPERGGVGRDRRYKKPLVFVGLQWIAFEEGDLFVKQAGVAGNGEILRYYERQPQQIVGAEGSHAHARFRMPPMLNVAFDELPRSRTNNVLPRNFGTGVDQGQRILQLIAKSEGAAGLIKRGSAPET